MSERRTATIGYRMYVTAFGEFGAGMQGFLGRASAMGVVMFLFVLACSLVFTREVSASLSDVSAPVQWLEDVVHM